MRPLVSRLSNQLISHYDKTLHNHSKYINDCGGDEIFKLSSDIGVS